MFGNFVRNISEKLRDHRIKRYEKKLGKIRPDLMAKWYDEIEQKLANEYNEELERLGDKIYQLNSDVKDLSIKAQKAEAKYEEIKEERQELQEKIERLNEERGKLKTEKNQLKLEVKAANA